MINFLKEKTFKIKIINDKLPIRSLYYKLLKNKIKL